MLKYITLLFLSTILTQNLWAEAHITNICKPISKNMGWHSGDTVRWVQRVAPDLKANMIESERNKIIMSLKVDVNAKMGIVTDVKEQLKKAQALKINYSSKPKAII